MPMASLETAVALKLIGEAANISGLGVSVVTTGDDTVGTGDLRQLLVPIMTRRTFGLETGDLVFGTGIHRWGMFFCQRARILEHDISVANKYELVLLRVFVPLRALGSRMRQAVESRLGMSAVIAGGLEFAQRRAFRRHVRPGSDQLEEEKQACEDKCRLLQARIVHTQLMQYNDTEVPASQPGCVSCACRIHLHHSSLWKSGRSPCDCKSPFSLGCSRIPGRN